MDDGLCTPFDQRSLDQRSLQPLPNPASELEQLTYPGRRDEHMGYIRGLLDNLNGPPWVIDTVMKTYEVYRSQQNSENALARVG